MHGKMKSNTVPKGDLLIIAGDISMGGTLREVMAFNKWLGEIKDNFTHGIVFTPGNHDWLFEQDPALGKRLITNAKVLLHEPTEINGYKIFGSPYTPEFCDWAFNVPRGEELKTKWDQIPEDTQILITHGPPLNILDRLIHSSERVGCKDLSNRIDLLPNLELHSFGHIHYSYGIECHNGVTYVNSSICDEQYRPMNAPIIVDLT